MSQFPTYEDVGSALPRRTSGLAIASLICSLIFCCPVTTLLGVLLGVISLATIAGKPEVRGKGLALTGIVLGVLFTLGQVVAGYMAWEKVYRVMLGGPGDALTAAYAGDLDGFRRDFTAAPAKVSDAEIESFISDLESSFGGFQRSWILDDPAQVFDPGKPQAVADYELVFDHATVTATVTMVFDDPRDGGPALQIESIVIHAAEGRVIEFPPGGSAGGSGGPAAEGDPDHGG